MTTLPTSRPPRGRAPRALAAACALLLLGASAAAQCQRQQLEALLPAPADLLGESVALHGNWLLVGAPSGLPAGNGPGRVLVYRRQAGEWLFWQELTAPDGEVGARFGAALALDDNLAAVGAPADDEAGLDTGAAYVFVRLGDTWLNLDKLLPSDGAPGDAFGGAVAVSDDRIVVGARRHDALGPQSGAAYVFENPGGGVSWDEVAKLLPSDGAPGDAFGVCVAADADLVAVGSDLADDGGVSAGAVHVFRAQGGGFDEEGKLLPADPKGEAFFGRAVALDAERLVVAAPGQMAPTPGGGDVPAGAAYVFEQAQPGVWGQDARLSAPDPSPGDTFGAALGLRDGVLVVGATLTDRGAPNVGSAHVFRAGSGGWAYEREVFAADAAAGDNFGIAVAVDPPFAVVGAQFHGPLVPNAGAAYVFRGLADLAVWSDLGAGLAGTLGEPCAFGEGSLEPDAALLFSLNGALPGSLTGLVLGAAQVDLPFKGGTLVPDPLIVIFGLPTLDGRLDLVFPWPAGVPAGSEIYSQHMVVDPGGPAGFAGSNAVVSVAP